eukprot:102928-Chlamydomonas_euryale.AAC.1
MSDLSHLPHHAQVLTQFNRDSYALIRRRVRAPPQADGTTGDAVSASIVQIRVPPPPIPLAWGRTVAPFTPFTPGAAPPPLPWMAAQGGQMRNGGGAAAAFKKDSGALVAAAVDSAVCGEGEEGGEFRGGGEGVCGGPPPTCYVEVSDVPCAAAAPPVMRTYLAVLINSGWEAAADVADSTAGTGGAAKP